MEIEIGHEYEISKEGKCVRRADFNYDGSRKLIPLSSNKRFPMKKYAKKT